MAIEVTDRDIGRRVVSGFIDGGVLLGVDPRSPDRARVCDRYNRTWLLAQADLDWADLPNVQQSAIPVVVTDCVSTAAPDKRVLVITDQARPFVEVMMRGMPGAMVIHPSDALTGHRFNLILVAIGDYDPKVDWVEWYEHMKTRLDLGGAIVGMPLRILRDKSLRDGIREQCASARYAPLWRALDL